MTIVHICGACFYKEGMGYQENILPKMHKIQGHNTYILAQAQVANDSGGYDYETCDYVNKDGINVQVLKIRNSNSVITRKIRNILKVYDGVYEKLANLKPDVIFVHGGQFYSLIDIRRYVKNNKGTKLYIDQHMDYYNEPHNSMLMKAVNLFYGYELRKIAKYVNKFWGVTPWRCQYLREVYHLPENKIDLLVMGGDDTRINLKQKEKIRTSIRDKYGIPQDCFCIITGGKIEKSKNIDTLIEAFSNIKYEDARLLVFGSISSEMKNEIEILLENKQVVYIGWVDSNDIYDLFIAADLAIFPGTHSVLWEQACACGLPAMFNDLEGMHHVDLGGNCIFIDGNNKSQISTAIERIINSPDVYNKMKSTSMALGTKYFSYNEIAKKAISG